jgi:hypothetical protein
MSNLEGTPRLSRSPLNERPTIHRAHGLEEAVHRRDASGVGQILNMRRFRTSFRAWLSPQQMQAMERR